MNVNRRWLGASKKRISVLAAGLALLGVGWLALGNAAHERLLLAHVGARSSQVDASRPAPQSLQRSAWTPASVRESAQLHARSLMSGLPLMFEPNKGQANLNAGNPHVKFIARGSGYVLALGSEGATVSVRSSNDSASSKAAHFETIRMKLAGANPQSRIRAIDPLTAKTNYLLGNDPSKWRCAVPQFARVRYEDVYPGINLVFYGNRGHLEHDFQVAPGADPSRAELEFEGAQKLELQGGALIIKQTGGDFRLEAPRAYQHIDGRE